MNLDQNSQISRWAALFVLFLMLLILYFLFLHRFFVEHGQLNESIDELNQSRQKYSNQAAKIPELRKKIAEVKQVVGENDEFLQAETRNLGNAEITSIFKGIVNRQGVENSKCQIISQTPSIDRNPDQFEKIILRVRMRCQYEIIAKILNAIEQNNPRLFLSELRLESRSFNRYHRNRPKTPQPPANLEIRFDLFAYLKKPIEKKDEK